MAYVHPAWVEHQRARFMRLVAELEEAIRGSTAASRGIEGHLRIKAPTTVTSLTPGTWYFAVRARNSRSLESDNSNVAQATVTSSSASGTAAITVGSTPPTTPPPTTPPPGTGLRTINATVYDLTDSDINVAVGTIALGRPCDASLTVRNIYYKVTSSEVTFTRTPRTRAVVARCAR